MKKHKSKKENILEKLHLINEIYRDLIIENPYLENQLPENDYNKKTTTPEILDNLIYTWESINYSIKKIGDKCNTGEYIFYAYGLMQCIYTQQDMIMHLFIVFKINNKEAYKKRKNNRDLRNMLVGHPISVENKNTSKIKSTVLWCPKTKIEKIEFLYRKNGNFYEQEKKCYSIKEIIIEHLVFLNYSLDLILKEIKSLVKKYVKKRKNIVKLIEKEKHKELIKLTVSTNVGILKSMCRLDECYTYDALTLSLRKYKNHDRYKVCLNVFIKDIKLILLKEKIPESFINKIDKLLNQKNIKKKQYKVNEETMIKNNIHNKITITDNISDIPEKFEFQIKSGENNSKKIQSEKQCRDRLLYYLEKSREKLLRDLKTLKRELQKYPIATKEIEYLEESLKKNLKIESNISRKYLKHLISSILELENI